MSEKANILCVDDEPINRIVISELLKEDYNLQCVEDGQACLDAVEKSLPDLILLDVSMPVMDGLTVCRRLRLDDKAADLPIIFVSALASATERMAGFEAGGDDYITKPFNEDELLTKISLALRTQSEIATLQTTSEDATQMAMSAMNSVSEMGEILRFMQDSFHCKDKNALASRALKTLSAFSLQGCLFLRLLGVTLFVNSAGKERPLERQVLEQLRSQGKIYEFGHRAVFNADNTALLVNNMPEDEAMAIRFKDNISLLVAGIEARLHSLEIDTCLDQKQRASRSLFEAAQENLQAIDRKHKAQRHRAASILSGMGGELEGLFVKLGLSETQEAEVIKLINDVEERIDTIFQEGHELDEHFEQTMRQLNASLLND